MIFSKKDRVIKYVSEKKYREALKICKSWRLPISREESDTLKRGYECMLYPDFYTRLGYSPHEEICKAISILESIQVSIIYL